MKRMPFWLPLGNSKGPQAFRHELAWSRQHLPSPTRIERAKDILVADLVYKGTGHAESTNF